MRYGYGYGCGVGGVFMGVGWEGCSWVWGGRGVHGCGMGGVFMGEGWDGCGVRGVCVGYICIGVWDVEVYWSPKVLIIPL